MYHERKAFANAGLAAEGLGNSLWGSMRPAQDLTSN